MVVLQYGGLYADMDTECRKPFDELIQENDAMIAGWERESATPEIAAEMRDVRQRQVTFVPLMDRLAVILLIRGE